MSPTESIPQRVKQYFANVRRRNNLIAYCGVRLFKSSQTFTFQGETYENFWRRYNATWRNERAVEIPITRRVIEKSPASKILEVGNVLSHYGPVRHDVVDKYEQAYGVINEDVCTFRPVQKYDLIVSVSTLEHVGWDEHPRQPEKVLTAFENLRSLLAPGGRIFVTLPLGYNPPLDEWIRKGKISFTKRFYLKRMSPANDWRETEYAEVLGAAYDSFVPTATALAVGYIEAGLP